VVTAYLLAETISTPLFGKMGDLYGRKRLFQASIVIFVVGSALSGMATSMACSSPSGAVQGAGAGAHRAGHGDHRRRRQPARARPLPGLLRRRASVRPAWPARCSAASSPTT
jgi:MFS family permease